MFIVYDRAAFRGGDLYFLTYFRAQTCFPFMVYLALPPPTTASTADDDLATTRANNTCSSGETSCMLMTSMKSPNFLSTNQTFVEGIDIGYVLFMPYNI